MSGYRCFPQRDPVRHVLSAKQRSVYDELVLNMEFQSTHYLLGNKRMVIPRGHTIFSLAGLAEAAAVEKTLARMTVDRLAELGVFEKITVWTQASLPDHVGPVPHSTGIPPLIPADSTSHRQTPTVVRFHEAETFLNYWRRDQPARSTAEIPPEIPPAIAADDQKRKKSAK